MFKIILEAGSVEYDEFLERLLNYAKDHPEQLGGMKLPPFSAQMLKMLPANQKNEMFAAALCENKAKMIGQLEMILSRFIGPVRVRDYDLAANKAKGHAVDAMAEFSDLNNYYYIDHIMPVYYSELTAVQMLPETYSGSRDLAAVQNYMKQQEPKLQRLLIAKSISANKQTIMKNIERAASANRIRLQLNNIRIMVK